MPWQRSVLDVALEHDREGIPAYRTVVVTVPRQNGKTYLLWSLMLWRALAHEGEMIIATAQTGMEAMDKWRDFASFVESHPATAGRIHELRRSNGSEVIAWDTGTRHRVRPPTATAGHGVTLDLGIVDEAWALKDEVVLQSMRPAMVTRPRGQLWIVSTAGTAESRLLRRHVELGRAAVAEGRRNGLAYFEWSAADGEPADDPETWARCMPALGHTITTETVALDRETLTPGEFERAYLNRWTDVGESVVAAGAWLACLDPFAAPGEPLWLGVDVSPARDAGSIVAAGWMGDRVALELIDHRVGGVEWIVPRVVELLARHNVAGIVMDATGPAAALAPDLPETATLIPYRGMQHASATIYDAIAQGALAVRPHDDLDAAVRGARQLGSGDLWRWGRKRSAADVSPLVAATLAYYQARERRGGSLRVW